MITKIILALAVPKDVYKSRKTTGSSLKICLLELSPGLRFVIVCEGISAGPKLASCVGQSKRRSDTPCACFDVVTDAEALAEAAWIVAPIRIGCAGTRRECTVERLINAKQT
jgi:hypothetical protein